MCIIVVQKVARNLSDSRDLVTMVTGACFAPHNGIRFSLAWPDRLFLQGVYHLQYKRPCVQTGSCHARLNLLLLGLALVDTRALRHLGAPLKNL